MKIVYPAQQLLWAGLFLFLFKVESRRNVKFRMGTAAFRENLNFILHGEGEPSSFPHGDTINYFLERVGSEHLGKLPVEMVRALIRKKCFVSERLLGRYYVIGMDGSELFSFTKRHCEFCLTRTKKEDALETTQFYHRVLEAKLLSKAGLALSMGTAFVENVEVTSKQDCELKAFYRLEKRLKENFPQLAICLVLDGLYAGAPVFNRCRQNRWSYLITFKEGSMPDVYQEYEALKALLPENRLILKKEDLEQTYAWICGIEYQGHVLNVLECVEIQPNQPPTRFVWLTDLPISKTNCVTLAEAGRRRWKIENEGFNLQKNGGYALEHPYSWDPVAMKNFYYLLQMAHTIHQLIEKGNLLKTTLVKIYGNLRNFALELWVSLTKLVFDAEAMRLFLDKPIQIRWNTS